MDVVVEDCDLGSFEVGDDGVGEAERSVLLPQPSFSRSQAYRPHLLLVSTLFHADGSKEGSDGPHIPLIGERVMRARRQ